MKHEFHISPVVPSSVIGQLSAFGEKRLVARQVS